MELGDFKGFDFGEGDLVDILQFADDTLIIGDGSNDNLWCIKLVLCGFEIMSGLKVNFYKNNIYGVNISKESLNIAYVFLTCGVSSFPFKFLGMLVAGSPRKGVMWKDVINCMRSRLCKWSGKFLSIGRRVV